MYMVSKHLTCDYFAIPITKNCLSEASHNILVLVPLYIFYCLKSNLQRVFGEKVLLMGLLNAHIM